MSELPNIISIFIQTKKPNAIRKESYPKVIAIEKAFDTLYSLFQAFINEWQKTNSTFNHSLTISFRNNNSDPHVLRIEKLRQCTEFFNHHQAIKHFLEFARVIYRQNKEIDNIKRVYNQYDTKATLALYLTQPIIFKVTNYCLRATNLEALKCCRLIAQDLKLEIQSSFTSNAKKFTGLLYKGALINDTMWEQLTNYQNKEIIIPEFLLANKEVNSTHEFLLHHQSESKIKTMITIIMPPCISRQEEGFAELNELSIPEHKDGVIFNLNSRFTVVETTSIKLEETDYRHLVLVYSYKKRQQIIQREQPTIQIPSAVLYQRSCTQCQKDVVDDYLSHYLYLDLTSDFKRFICSSCLKNNSDEKSPLLCISPYLYQLAFPDVDKILEFNIHAKVENVSEASFIPFYGKQCANCQRKSDNIEHLFRCLTCCSSSKEWCQNCVDIESHRKCIVTGHEIVVERSAYRLWTWKDNVPISTKVRLDQRNNEEEESRVEIYDEEYDYADENLLKRFQEDDQISIAKAYSKLGLKHSQKNALQLALRFYEKSLAVRKFIIRSKSDHRLIIPCFNEFGSLYSTFNDLEKAEHYLTQALSLTKDIYGIHHNKTIDALNNLEILYTSFQQHSKAAEIHDEILKIKTLIFSEESEEIVVSCDRLASIYYQAHQYEKAISFSSRASRLSVQQPNHERIRNLAQSYHSIADEDHNPEEAIENYTKALEYYHKLEKCDPAPLLKIHESLIKIYQQANDDQNVIKHSLKELELSKLIHGNESEKVAQLYENLGAKYKAMRNLKEAIASYTKALEYYNSRDESHPVLLLNVHKTLINIYEETQEDENFIQHSLREIELSHLIYHGEERIIIAKLYNKLGFKYTKMRNHEEAIQMYKEALKLKISLLGEDHNEVKMLYASIADVYFYQENNQLDDEYRQRAKSVCVSPVKQS